MARRWPPRPRWVIVGAAVVVLVAGALAARAFWQRLPDLASPGGDGTARFVAATRAETPYVVEGYDVCLRGTGSVTVTDVAFVTNQGGARVVDWGVRPSLRPEGTRPAEPTTLDARGDFDRQTVTRPCGEPTESSELAIEVRKSSPELGQGMDLRITYETGPFTRELEIETDVVLCGPSDRSAALARQCAQIAAEDPEVP